MYGFLLLNQKPMIYYYKINAFEGFFDFIEIIRNQFFNP